MGYFYNKKGTHPMKARLLSICFVGLFVLFCSRAFADEPVQPTLPDSAAWEMALDHTPPFLYHGKKIQLHDEHYVWVNDSQTEVGQVVVFFTPEADAEWFAIYMKERLNSETGEVFSEAYLFEFERKEEGGWRFVEDLLKVEDLVAFLESRYGLRPIEE